MNIVSIVLVVLTVVTGIMWVLDLLVLRPRRKAELASREAASIVPLTKTEKKDILEPNGMWGSLVSCFPVLLVVFLLRSFAYEPFRIPSASMMPTLLRGDFVLVEKFRYGIRNPFTNNVIYPTSQVKRGDIVVFKYPENTNIDYIKRIIGLPGDTVRYDRGTFYVRPAGATEFTRLDAQKDEVQPYLERDEVYPSEYGIVGTENLLGYKHKIMHDAGVLPRESFYEQPGGVVLGNEYGEWTVPEGQYFAIGDNREHSRDSRFWGFVPDSYVVGRAVCIWMNFTTDGFVKLNRLGHID